ncbi:hypothetical protein LTR95_006949 [Oleoguttula sp. CCFEE 5521]
MYRTVLEVERKFAGFADVYYDVSNRLSSKGVWLRKRQLVGKSPTWEVKCRRGGNFNKSMFEEYTNLQGISSLVKNLTGRQTTAANNFGLDIIASLNTDRKSWRADKHFKIVLDCTDFGHEVGEVELERIVVPPGQEDNKFDIAAWNRKITQEIDSEIHGFMTHYHWAFRKEEPIGKLTAYFERQRQDQGTLRH